MGAFNSKEYSENRCLFICVDQIRKLASKHYKNIFRWRGQTVPEGAETTACRLCAAYHLHMDIGVSIFRLPSECKSGCRGYALNSKEQHPQETATGPGNFLFQQLLHPLQLGLGVFLPQVPVVHPHRNAPLQQPVVNPGLGQAVGMLQFRQT